jgi:hypothetical protein
MPLNSGRDGDFTFSLKARIRGFPGWKTEKSLFPEKVENNNKWLCIDLESYISNTYIICM